RAASSSPTCGRSRRAACTSYRWAPSPTRPRRRTWRSSWCPVREGAARVLAALRRAPGRAVSGAELSAALGVSRAQIWKHVETLRGLGYGIEGEPGGGYRLAAIPDRLYAEELQPRLHTRWLARTYEWFESTDSTNRVAMERARAGAPHGATVVAEGQTAGRGRLGRSFFSPPGLNLYTSIVLRPRLDTARAPTAIL